MRIDINMNRYGANSSAPKRVLAIEWLEKKERERLNLDKKEDIELVKSQLRQQKIATWISTIIAIISIVVAYLQTKC